MTIAKRLLCLGILFLPVNAQAEGRAEVMMLPTRVVMENKDRYATVTIKNVGDATGNFTVELIDMEMQESGMVVPVANGASTTYSAIPYVKVAPRSMTLKPGASQNVRLMLRLPENLEDGEYRAHLRVRIDDDNVDASGESKKAEKDVAIEVKANLVLVIPVIFRHGKTEYSMQIDSPKLMRDSKGKPSMEMDLLRQGNRSSMGDISVYYVSAEGKSQLLKFFPGVPVYRPVPKRHISVPLDVPKSVNLSTGNLRITYAAQEKEGGKVLAEKTMSLR